MPSLGSYWRPRTWRVLAAAAITLGLSFGARPLAAQAGTVQGAVTAATTGEPIAGAEVTVGGTNVGTRTGADGRFTLLNVPEGSREIRVLAIGYRVATLQITVAADQTTSANVALTTSVLQLDAVVVTGTGGQARVREVGNSIAQINVSQVKDPPANMDQLLQARAPGLSVMQSTGSAGAGAQIRLRGAVSVSQSNQPIIYIDGIRVRSEGYRRNRPATGTDFEGRSTNVQSSPLNDINPTDIERVEIIKGAAASTLYGTEAAAGVIQIFTKKGSGGAPRWTLQLDQGFAKLEPFGPDWNPYLNFTPGDSMVLDANNQLRSAATYSSAGYCPDLVAASRATFQNTGVFPAVDACSFLRTGYRQRTGGSVTGGFNAFQYFLSGSWEDLDGVLPQDNEKKLVTRGNFSFDLSDKVRLDWNTVYSNLNVTNTPSGNNAQGLTLNVFRAERNYRQTSNPIVLDSLLHQRLGTEIDRLITGGTVYYTPLPQFTNRFTIGLDLASQENRGLRPFGFVAEPLGVLYDEQNKYTTLTADYVGNVDLTLASGLGSTFSFGGQSVTTEEVSTHAFGRGFGGPGEPTVSSASLFISRESRIRVVNAGFFFQNVFKLRDRYFLTLGGRFDGNSAFGRDFGIQAYPKASMSYVVSDEPFWPSGWGELKVRAALGWSGRAPGAFDAVKTWIGAASSGQPAALPNNLGNPDLGPERTREAEFGFDGAFFRGRLSTAFTWYHRRTTDALFPVRQIPSLGILNSQLTNVGAIRSTGIEAAVSGTVFQGGSVGLDLGMTAFTNRSLVLDLGLDAQGYPVAPFAAGGGWMEAGFPVMAAKGTRIRNPDALATPDTLCVRSAGDPCASDGQYIFGPQQPTFILGVNASVRLPKGISLSARGEYQGGAWIYQGSAANALQRSVRWPTCRRAHLVLEGGGTASELTARERLECVPTTLQDDVLWEPQDFFKLRDVTLAVPLGALMPRANAATLTLTAQNWFRWYNSGLRMFDPEMTDRDSLNEQNRTISEHIPAPAIFTASLRVTF
jgi:TonB-linked SusC/RagA family outer membrane protein